jgi:2-methylcitrate dehydratase
MREQYLPERIEGHDVQQLLRRIAVQPSDEFSDRFPEEMPCRISVRLRDDRRLTKESSDYEGFHTKPMSWDAALKKYERLSRPYTTTSLRNSIVRAVADIEDTATVTPLMQLLRKVRTKASKPDSPGWDSD